MKVCKKNLSDDEGSRKRQYAAPKLTRYGALRDLTQSGTGTLTENGNPGNCSQTPSRKPCTSDRNAKQNIVSIGCHPLGFGLYLFDYKYEFRDAWGHDRQFGVIAQEVESVVPEAVVVHPDGYKMVDYDMLGIVRFVQ